MIRLFGARFPPFHSIVGLFGNQNFNTRVLQSIENKNVSNQYPKWQQCTTYLVLLNPLMGLYEEMTRDNPYELF